MPYRRFRRARRGTRGTVSRVTRNYLLGILLLAVGVGVVAAVGALGSVLSYTISATIGATTISIPASLLINAIGWVASVVLVISALRKFGVFV